MLRCGGDCNTKSGRQESQTPQNTAQRTSARGQSKHCALCSSVYARNVGGSAGTVFVVLLAKELSERVLLVCYARLKELK